jgi:hypothetical protein
MKSPLSFAGTAVLTYAILNALFVLISAFSSAGVAAP